MNRFPLISIVIVAFNSEECIEECIDSALNLDYPKFELIVVDGGSTDSTIKKIEAKLREAKLNQNKVKRVKMICNKNLGVSADRNAGIKLSKGKYIFLIDADAVVERNSLRELVKIMETNPRIGAATPKILYMNGNKICSAGVDMDRYGWTFCSGNGEDSHRYSQPRDLICADSTTMLVRKSILKKTDIFDEYFFYYHEATDFFYRVILSKNRIVYWPKAVAYHKSGHVRKRKPITARLFLFSFYHIVFIIKDYDLKDIIRYGIPIFTISFLFSVYLFMRRRFDVSFSFLNSLIATLRDFKTIWKKHLFVKYVVRQNLKCEFDSLFSKPQWALVVASLKDMGLF